MTGFRLNTTWSMRASLWVICDCCTVANLLISSIGSCQSGVCNASVNSKCRLSLLLLVCCWWSAVSGTGWCCVGVVVVSAMSGQCCACCWVTVSWLGINGSSSSKSEIGLLVSGGSANAAVLSISKGKSRISVESNWGPMWCLSWDKLALQGRNRDWCTSRGLAFFWYTELMV